MSQMQDITSEFTNKKMLPLVNANEQPPSVVFKNLKIFSIITLLFISLNKDAEHKWSIEKK